MGKFSIFTYVLLLMTSLANAATDNDTTLFSLSLEELMNTPVEVSVASKRIESVQEAPGIITVISREDLSLAGVRSLYDALMRIPGFFDAHSQQQRMALGTRGDQAMFGNHLLFLINGRPFRQAYNSGDPGELLNLLPLEAVDHVEVIRGPGSVLYGSSAYDGVINVVTRTSKKLTAEAACRINGTEDPSLSGFAPTVFGGIGSDSHHVSIAGGYSSEDGTRRPVLGPNLKATEITPYRRGTLGFLDAGWKGFTLSALIAECRTPVFSGWVIPGDTSQTTTLFADLGYRRTLTKFIDLQANLTHHNESVSRLGQIKGLDTIAIVKTSLPSNSTIAELSANLHPLPALNIVAGVLGEHIIGTQTGTGEFNAVAKKLSPFASAILDFGTYAYTHASGYLQADWKPVPQVKLIAGMQANKPDGVDLDMVPRVGVVWNSDTLGGMKLLWGQAFRNSNPVQNEFNIDLRMINLKTGRDSIYPVTSKPSSPLKPEKVTTMEVELFRKIPGGSISVSGWYSKHKDLISTIPLPNGSKTYGNIDTFTVFGIDANLRMIIGQSISYNGGFSWAKAPFLPADKADFPEVSINNGIVWQPVSSVSADMNLRIMGPFAGAYDYRNQNNLYEKYGATDKSLVRASTQDYDFTAATRYLDFQVTLSSSAWFKLPVPLFLRIGVRNALNEMVFYPNGDSMEPYNKVHGHFFTPEDDGRQWFTLLEVRY